LLLYGLFWITLSYVLQFVIIGFFGFTTDTFSRKAFFEKS